MKKHTILSLNLPHGTYILSAAFDSGRGAQKDDYVSASGSGGFGHAKENPISVADPVKGINIDLRSAPMMQPKMANGASTNQRPPQMPTQPQ